MMEIDIVNAEDLDYKAFVALQKEAYAKILKKTSVSDSYMTPAYYRWKFNPPAGSAMIAFIREGGIMVASSAQFPVHICLGNTKLCGWQQCEAATLPSSRKKGYFHKCNSLLIDAIKPNNIAFAFPNQNSKHEFGKLGGKEKGIVTTWINPWSLFGKSSSSRISEVACFDKEQDALAERLVHHGKTMLDREAAYMNWRYVQNPVFKYTLFAYRKEGEQLGFAVVRRAHVLNQEIALIMDLWGLESYIEQALLRHITGWAESEGLRKIIFLDNAFRLIDGLLSGYIPIPSYILPKKQILMGFAKSGEKAKRLMNNKWRVQAGDWDTF
ncbi:MAG: hypothetical protein ACFFCW_25745 [Candidatus Hodarchaeota archaeon]